LIFIIIRRRIPAVIVCCCHRVTDREVRRAAIGGARTPREIATACGAGSSCGGCRVTVCEILDAVEDQEATLAVVCIATSESASA
jgi:bacterioferritin-associated ferredoxin